MAAVERDPPHGRPARGAARARLRPRGRRRPDAGARFGDRRHRRRARLHHAGEHARAARVQAGARRAASSRCPAAPSPPAARFPRPCSRPASRRSSRICSTAISRSCTPAPSRSASATCSARRCASCATSSARTSSTDEKMIGVLYLDSRERGALRSAAARAALETLSTEAAIAIENARLYREALERAKLEQELKVAAAIQQSLLPAAGRSGALLHRRRRLGAVPIGRRRLLRLRRPADRPIRLHRRRRRRQGVAGRAAGGGPARHVQRRSDVSAAAPRRCSRGSIAACFRRAIEARFLTSFYGDARARRLADLFQRRPQRADAGDEGRRAPARNRRRGARPVRARGVRRGNAVAEPRRRHRRLQRRRQRGDERGGRRIHRPAAAGVDRSPPLEAAAGTARRRCSPTCAPSAVRRHPTTTSRWSSSATMG